MRAVTLSVLFAFAILSSTAIHGFVLPLLLLPSGPGRSSVHTPSSQQHHPLTFLSLNTCLKMGRAAAVRAATKSKTDAKKAKTNARFGKKIIMAIKSGGGSSDVNANLLLRETIKQAKSQNVPVDNINRAIKKATSADTEDFKESIFEAYGFGGASLIINVLSDNNNRATADVKAAVNKQNAKMAESGSVLFLYDKKGKLTVVSNNEKDVVDEEALLEAAIEAGIDDYELLIDDGNGENIIYTDPKQANLMLTALQGMLGDSDASINMELVHVPKAPVECSEEDYLSNMRIIESLENLDDVDSVEHNMSNSADGTEEEE